MDLAEYGLKLFTMDLFIQATNGIHKTAILLDRIADVYPDMD
jgi:hypothetical protein